MKKKKSTLGTGVSNWENLRSYMCFFTKYSSIKKANTLFALIVLVAGFICSRVPAVPSSVCGGGLVLFLASMIGGEMWLDYYDDRIYVADRDVIIKAKGITKKYNWTDIRNVALLPDNVVMIEFVDDSKAVLKNLKKVDELIPILDRHIDESITEDD